jgi:hypothetical protein
MAAFARVHGSIDDPVAAAAWGERASVVGERLDLIEVIVLGLLHRGSALLRLNRPREAMILVRGAGELAQTHGLLDSETRSRTLQTFVAQWDDPRAGLEVARAGQQLAERVGSRKLGLLMVGNGVACASRVGEWDWAITLLAEWSTVDVPDNARLELIADQVMFDAHRGLDPSAGIARMEPMVIGLSDPQFSSYLRWAGAWAALAEGHLGDAASNARTAVETTGYFAAMTLPLAARASLWEGRAEEVRRVLDELGQVSSKGAALSADLLTIRAGLAALEGRTAEATSLYRDALRAWQALGLQWDEALCSIDMVTVLDPSDPEVRAAAESATSILTRLGATPYLARLSNALSRSGPVAGDQPATEAHAAQGSELGVEA